EEFRRCLAFQPNAAVRPRCRMNKALMKTVSRGKFAPVTHRVANVMAACVACGGRYNAIALHAKPVLAGALVFLFRVNRETAAGGGFVREASRERCRHQRTVALHYVNIFPRERNFYAHRRRIMWLVRGHVIWAARTHPASRRAASEQQDRSASSQQN